jgi:S-adenosylmethionine-diacylgycerolhomoserine-N-methlytransferase
MASPSPTGDHAVLMDRVYRHQRHIYDLTRKYYLFGRDRLIRELALKPGEGLVEIGCGTARNLIAIARRYPGSRLYGLDASHEMLKTAGEAVARAGLADRIGLVHAFAEGLSPRLFGSDTRLDRALFSYSLSMIPDWRGALRAAAAALPAEGSIHVVDFGDLSGLGRPGAALLRKWLSLFHVEPRTEILSSIEQAGGMAGNLWISPGRYAFVWRCGAGRLPDLAPSNVAAGSQPASNPPDAAVRSPWPVDIPSLHQPK